MYFLIRPKAGSELLINYIGIYLTEFACGIIGTGIFLLKLKLHFGFLLRNIDQSGMTCLVRLSKNLV